MKFGKYYIELLETSHFLPEWKKSAIQYNKLKALLNDVPAELRAYGLTPDVIDDLLYASGSNPPNRPNTERKRSTPGQVLQLMSPSKNHGNSHHSSAAKWVSSLPHDERYEQKTKTRKRRARSIDAAALYLMHSQTSPDTFLATSNWTNSVLSPSPKSHVPSRRHSSSGGHVFNANEHFDLPPLILPVGILHHPDEPNIPNTRRKLSHDEFATRWMEKRIPDFLPEDTSTIAPSTDNATEDYKTPQKHWIQGKGGRRAWGEYELFDENFTLQPRIIVHTESPNSLTYTDSPGTPNQNSSESSSSSVSNTPHMPFSAMRSARGSMQRLDLGSPAQEIPTIASKQYMEARSDSTPPGHHERRIIIPLKAEERFFDALITSIRTLLQLHMSQQRTLTNHVEALCQAISEVSSPVHSPADMYVWREIFSLWLEFDIFESSREKDRGELSVAASEARLHKYLEQLEKRGLLTPHQTFERAGRTLAGTLDSWAIQAFNPTNPLSDIRSIATLEHFLRLNVALVSIKRFERLNIETIRKLLKKHGKKTALHVNENISRISMSSNAQQLLSAASLDSPIPELNWESASGGDVLKSLAALAPANVNSSFQLSLPRIVSCLLTKALMPVLPSVDDYSCLVCVSIAWHPIRLRCGHLFCIRCIVKLQKQGTNDCPLCRAPNAVRDADEHNLDVEMTKYLQEWFPREIEEKTSENKSDRLLQERKEKEIRKKNRWARFRTRYHSENERERDCVIA